MSDTPDQPGQAPVNQNPEGPAPSVSEKELKEARQEAARYRTELRKLQEAQEAAQREAAEKSGEYQKLYETEKTRAAELEARAAEAEAATSLLSSYVKEIARELPEDVRRLLPESLPVAAQLEWLKAARKVAAKITESRTPGTPPGPRGNGTVTIDSSADLVAKKRASGIY